MTGRPITEPSANGHRMPAESPAAANNHSVNAKTPTNTSSSKQLSPLHPYTSKPNTTSKLLYLFLGTAVGVLLRYGFTYAFTLALSPTADFPVGTDVSNFLGCFVIGAVTSWYRWDEAEHKKDKPAVKLLLVTALCGSLTTFSSYVNDTFTLIHSSHNRWSRGAWLAAINIIVVNNLLCFMACAVGYHSMHWMRHARDAATETAAEPDKSEARSEFDDAEVLNVDDPR